MMLRLAFLLGFILRECNSNETGVAADQQPQIFSKRGLQGVCPVRVGVSRCPGLVASTGVEPDEDCDCYQFCGDEYVGCCSLGDDAEDCQADCDDVNIIPTAGCRLDGVTDPAPEPVCTMTLPVSGRTRGFEEGESFGNLLVSPCGDIEDYPCFCSGLEDDKIRCPYCPFLTNENTIVCARSGGEVTFVDEFDIQQTCSCRYLGNNQIETFCDPQDVPLNECALQRNADQCAELTEFMNFDPDCPCVNFCLGQKVGCCGYGESCAVQCPGGSNAATDIVAGCEIDPFKQPVTPPPIVPTQAPAPAPRECVLQQNTGKCPELIQNQAPVQGCGQDDCYNYCDDTFHGCCALDDFECSVSCQGPTQPVITAGCRLDGTSGGGDDGGGGDGGDGGDGCKSLGQPCLTSSDCCTNRCLAGKCARAGFLGSLRTKLSGTRGGAGAVVKAGSRELLDGEDSKVRGV